MNRQLITIQLLELKGLYAINNTLNLKKNIKLTYFRFIIDQLLDIFGASIPDAEEVDHGELCHQLKIFFDTNWELINGTLLSYTSLPNEEITNFLINIAANISPILNIPPIKILMPTVSLSSLKPETYVSLEEIISPVEIKNILQTHILGFQGLYLLPIKILTEISLSAETTTLFNPYFDCFDHPAVNSIVNQEELQRLIGHNSLTKALFDQKQVYDHLSCDSSNLLGQLSLLVKQLELHSSAGLGAENNAAGGVYAAIIAFMQYYTNLEHCIIQIQDHTPTIHDLNNDFMMGYIVARTTPEDTALYFVNRYNENSYVKKISHGQQALRYELDLVSINNQAELTQLSEKLSKKHPTLIKVREEQIIYMLYGYNSDQQWGITLLNNAQIACHKLNFPAQASNTNLHVIHLPLDAVSKEIYENISNNQAHISQPLSKYLYQGWREDAATSEQCSLEQLHEIKCLTDHDFFAEPNRIPNRVQTEINCLFALVHDSKKNINATSNFQTCIATRRHVLANNIVGQESILSTISLSNTNKSKQIYEAQQKFAIAFQKLQDGIKPTHTHLLDGYDHLSINIRLLKKLHIKFSINSLEELHLLHTLSHDEILLICNDREITEQIIEQINNLENLVLFLTETSLDKMSAFLNSSKILKHFIKNKEDIRSLLQVFDIAKIQLIADHLIEQTPHLLNIDTIQELHKAISEEQLSVLVTSWNILQWPIESIDGVLLVMQIAPQQIQSLYFKHLDIISSKKDSRIINKILVILTEECRENYLQIIITKLPSLMNINNSFDMMRHILEPINQAQRNLVFSEIKTILINNLKIFWNHSSNESALIFLQYLTPEEGTELLNTLKYNYFNSPHCNIMTLIANLKCYQSESTCSLICKSWHKNIVQQLKSETEIFVLFAMYNHASGFQLNHVLYENFKEHIVKRINSYSKYKQLKIYLSTEDQIDLNHRLIIKELTPWVTANRLQAFQYALIENESYLKTSFDALFKVQYNVKSMFNSTKQTHTNLIDIISNSELGWLNKINRALSLGLDAESLSRPNTVQIALDNYIEQYIPRSQIMSLYYLRNT